jgi:hypothetical protein
MAMLEAVTLLVNGVESADSTIKAKCVLALSLARKLDEAVDDTSSTSAMAVPSLSKELRSAIDDISGVNDEKEQFMAGIFADSVS